MRCPRCEKENNENQEICQYCGYNLKEYKERVRLRKENMNTTNGFATGYNVFIGILAILIFIGGIIVGQNETYIMFACWILGIIFLVIINMLKNIIEELRKISAKIK